MIYIITCNFTPLRITHIQRLFLYLNVNKSKEEKDVDDKKYNELISAFTLEKLLEVPEPGNVAMNLFFSIRSYHSHSYPKCLRHA